MFNLVVTSLTMTFKFNMIKTDGRCAILILTFWGLLDKLTIKKLDITKTDHSKYFSKRKQFKTIEFSFSDGNDDVYLRNTSVTFPRGI